MPTHRLGLAICSVGGKIYAIGGYAQAGSPGLRTVEEYDPATDRWRERAAMPTGRRWLAAGAVNGRCYAIGGHTGQGQPGLATVEEYDPAANSWRSRADLPAGRVGHTVAVADGRIYVIAGGPTSNDTASSVYSYDPAANAWSVRADTPVTPGYFAAAETVRGKVYVLGGSAGSTDVQKYDPDRDTWTRAGSIPSARDALTASAVNGRIYVIGGKEAGSRGGAPLASVEEFDPEQDSSISRADLPDGRWGLASGVVDGRIYAIGGSGRVPSPHPGEDLNEEYTPPPAAEQTVRRCFFDAETLAPLADVRVKPRKGPEVRLGESACSDEIPYDSLTIEAPGYRARKTHAANGKTKQRRAALPGEDGTYFGLFQKSSSFTDLVDSGRTVGKKKQRGFLQGLPFLKFEIVRPADFPMPLSELRKAAVAELRKRARFKKPSFSMGDAVTREDQILLRHVPGQDPTVECTILEDGVCWGPLVSLDAVAGDRKTSLEEGLRRIFFHGSVLITDAAEVKAFYRGYQASVVGQRLKRRKEFDVVAGPGS